MTRSDYIALLLSLLAVAAAWFVAAQVFENIAHLEDEIAYVWQAELIAEGQLTTPSPPHAQSFLVPFVVDYEGQRFGKYPLGWPAALALGVILGARGLVNPVLAGLGVWLTYRLGSKLMGETVGLLAAGLTLTSPFFLINSGSLLSHPLGLVLSGAFVLAWLDLTGSSEGGTPPWLLMMVAGLSLGLLALTRPLTAVALGIPFGLHGLVLLARGSWPIRRLVLGVGVLVLLVGSLNFLWQYAATGDPFFNLYTLWWEYDKVGFGPGVGVVESGHTLRQGWINSRFSLRVGVGDLFGWFRLSWIFLPFGLLASLWRRNWHALLVSSVFPVLFTLYLAYWVGSWLFGPRYYYEGLFSLTIVSAAGIAFLAGWPLAPGEPWPNYSGLRKARPLVVTAIVLLLAAANLVYYTPMRLERMHNLYGMERADLAPFREAREEGMTPALVIVHPEIWMDYGVLLELQDPQLESPFIFIMSRGANADAEAAEDFPERKVYHYYPEEPYKFYTAPK